jgi:FAD:protein FMN transferase
MATRFEVVVCGDHEPALRAAAEEALGEVQRIESQLSLYRPDSEVAHLNARAANEWVRVSPELFQLLERVKELSREADGAFDITIAPLVRCWGFMGGSGKKPAKAAIAEARSIVGMDLVELDQGNCAVRFRRPGVMLDFGAVGKGYAIDRAAAVLKEAGILSFILHGGTSTVYALGKPPAEPSWKVAIEAPPGAEGEDGALLTVVELDDETLSVSAVWGKSFEAKGKTYGHVIDPRTGYPAANADLAAVVLPSGTDSDALSTALLTAGPEESGRISGLRHGMRTLVMKRKSGRRPPLVKTHGIALR